MLVSYNWDILKTTGSGNEIPSNYKECNKEWQTQKLTDNVRPLSETTRQGDWGD